MNPLEHDSDVKTSAFYRSTTRFTFYIIGIQSIVALITYPFLPASVPTHWNFAGQVSGYTPKTLEAPLIPISSLITYVLMRILIAASPQQCVEQAHPRRGSVDLVLMALLLFSLVLQLALIAFALHLPVDMSFVITLSFAALLVFTGNYMGKLRRNYWTGIKTPWTLASDVIWERTHRIGGWLFVGTGLVGLVTSFVPVLRLWVVSGLMVVIVVALWVYSYVLYRRVGPKGGRPVSSPSDAG